MASRETFGFGTVTASSTSGQSAGVDTGGIFDQFNVYANVTNVTAGSVTFNVQTSPDNTNWYTHTSSAAISSAGNTLIKLAANVGRYVRIDYVIATGPVTFTVSAEGVNTSLKGRF